MSNEFISADAFFIGSLPRAAQDYPVSAQAEITQQTAAEGVVPLGGGVGGASTDTSRVVTATAIALPPLPPGGGPGYAPSVTTGRVLLALIGSPSLGRGELIFGGTDSPEARSIEVDDLPTIPAEKIFGTFDDDQIPGSIARDSEVSSAIELLSRRIDDIGEGTGGGGATSSEFLPLSIVSSAGILSPNREYWANSLSLLPLQLPLSAQPRERLIVRGFEGTKWRVTQDTGQSIQFGNKKTTAGASGRIESLEDDSMIELIYRSNGLWFASHFAGNFEVL